MPDLPTGFDRADGVDGRLGTATPSAQLTAKFKGSEGAVKDVVQIEEAVDSPVIERAEQATITHRFNLPWEEAMNRIQYLGRGLVRTDSSGNVVKLLSADISHGLNDMAVLRTVDEGLSFDSPPDQFQIVPVELGIHILKHPRYFYAFLGDGVGSTTEKRNQMVIRLLQNYFEKTTPAYRDALIWLLLNSIGSESGTGAQPPQYKSEFNPEKPTETGFRGSSTDTTPYKVSGTDIAKRAAIEIIQKYWRGEETPYVVGYQITWSSFYFRPPYLNPGGYIENPLTEASPLLPDYFWSPDYPPSTATIFDYIDDVNPQCYSETGLPGGGASISWLRKADEIDYERTWFKITRTWIGSPVGFWDTELYTAQKRPTTAAEYLVAQPT